MHRFGLILVCLSLGAQNEPPTFRATTQLVEFSVVAMDRKGNPALGLTKDDFALFDNGKRREIAFFRYEGGPENGVAVARPPLPAHVFTNRVEMTGGPARNITALVIDSSNTETVDQMMVNAQAMMFLRALAPQTRVAVFQLGRQFRVIHDFTDDMESLRARLAELKVEFQTQKLSDVERSAREAEEFLGQMEKKYYSPMTEADIARQRMAVASEVNFNTVVGGNRVEATMRLLELLGGHIAGIPGRKSVVWISGGIQMFSSTVAPTGKMVVPAVGESYEKAIRRTSEKLAQSGVALYAVDASGLKSSAESLSEKQYMPPIGGGRFGALETADAYSRDTRAAFGMMTGITGGRYFVNTNDFSDAIRKATSDLQGTYSIGFYADAESDGKWRTLKASVRRPGVELLHRQGYQVAAAAGSKVNWSPEQLQLALRNPLGESSIHLNAYCARAPGGAPGEVRLTVQVDTDDVLLREAGDRRQAELDVVVGEKTTDGKVRFQQETIRLNFTAQQAEVAREKGIPYRKQWKPGADTAVVRVLVRDKATGRLGTLDVRYD